MKLARPNVFHPRIVLTSRRDSLVGDADDAGLVGVLRRRGLPARWLPWDDPQTAKADLVILRAVPAVADRRAEFLAWTTRVPNLLNPPAVVAWNSDRRYLGDLAAAGVPVIDSEDWSGPGDDRVGPDRTALVFLGGEQSHAFQSSSTAVSQPAEPDFELWDLGYAVLDAACAQVRISRTELLCARVDLVGGTEAAALRGLDVIAPDLGWGQLDDATRGSQQRRFALAVESACERLGLGPLSHRGSLPHRGP